MTVSNDTTLHIRSDKGTGTGCNDNWTYTTAYMDCIGHSTVMLFFTDEIIKKSLKHWPNSVNNNLSYQVYSIQLIIITYHHKVLEQRMTDF